MKKVLTSIILSLLCLCAFAQTPKYVFYLIGDGMGINHVYYTDKFNEAVGAEPVNFFHFPVRTFVNTYSASSYVTDSAAAGSALSTGSKVNNASVAWSVDGQPLESIAEKAKKAGFATGVVTNVAITDATPAAFYAKAETRGMSTTIARQLIDSKVDFAAGEYFQTEKGSKLKTDYWVEEAKKAGIEVYRGKNEYKRTDSRVLMLPATGSIPYAIDRKQGDEKLSDFTESAIDYLYSKSKKGFFLAIEGGKIDYVAHSDDAGGVVREVNDFCETVDIVLSFCEQHPNECLVVVVADHETGGFCAVRTSAFQGLEILSTQKCSTNTLTNKLVELQNSGQYVSWALVKKLIQQETGLWSRVEVSESENKVLTELYKESFLDGDSENVKDLYSENKKLAVEVIRYLDEKAGVKFVTTSHSSAPLGLYVYGKKATQFCGLVENTDIPKTIAKVAKY